MIRSVQANYEIVEKSGKCPWLWWIGLLENEVKSKFEKKKIPAEIKGYFGLIFIISETIGALQSKFALESARWRNRSSRNKDGA